MEAITRSGFYLLFLECGLPKNFSSGKNVMGNCSIVLRLFFSFTLCYIGNIVSEKFHITISSMKVMLIFIRTLKLASAVKRLKGRILHVNADQKRLYSTLLRNSLKKLLFTLEDINSAEKHY